MNVRLDGLRLQLLVLIILPFSLLLLVAAVAGVRVHEQAMRRLVAERDERSAAAAAASISEQLHHRQAAILGLALRLEDGVLPGDLISEAAYLWPDFDAGLAVIGMDGEALASSIAEADWAARPLSQILFAEVEAEPTFSPAFRESGDWMILIGARVDGGAAVGAISLDRLLRFGVSPPAGGDGSSVLLVSASGALLGAVGEAYVPTDLRDHPGVRAALRGERGSSFVPGFEGEHMVAFSPVQPTGWALVIDEPWQSVTNPLLNLSLAAPLALAPALLITLLALWFGATRVIQPLRRLERQAEDLAGGEFEAIERPVGGIAEIRQLQESLARMAGRLSGTQQSLRAYLNRIMEAQEEERRRLARELHDQAIQDWIAVGHQLQMAAKSLAAAGRPEAEKLEALHADAQRAVESLRRLSRGLRPIYLEDLGLVPALEMLSRDAQLSQRIPVSFEVSGEVRRMAPDKELAVYRIVQEALSNAVRHAQADQINVRLWFGDGVFRARVGDDGIGFTTLGDPPELGRAGHFGLIGMFERAQLIGAELDIHTVPDKGSRIELTVPLAD